MELREEFAIAALQGLLSHGQHCKGAKETVADAYKYADEMIKQSEPLVTDDGIQLKLWGMTPYKTHMEGKR